MSAPRRLDQWLVDKGYFESREKAKTEIELGHILDAKTQKPILKASRAVLDSTEIIIIERERFVSRAGEKLHGFLENIGDLLELKDRVALDVGSSTGGFTEVLLRRGVKEIHCVDVGSNQLHLSLRKDPRVRLYEQSDIRDFRIPQNFRTPEIIVIDVSFISVRKILPKLIQDFKKADFILLFKPQFETPKNSKSKRGLVAEKDRAEALESFRKYLGSLRLKILAERESELKGKEGNQESLFLFRLDVGKS